MSIIDPFSKGRTVTRTIRIDEGYDQVLQEEAARRRVSVNNIMDQLVKKYVQSWRFFENMSAITLSDRTLKSILEGVEEDKIREIGRMLGKERPYELILKRGLVPSYETAKWFIVDVLTQQSGWLNAAITRNDRKEYIHLSHPFGYKWSLFLEGYFGVFYRERLGLNFEVDLFASSITFIFDRRELERAAARA